MAKDDSEALRKTCPADFAECGNRCRFTQRKLVASSTRLLHSGLVESARAWHACCVCLGMDILYSLYMWETRGQTGRVCSKIEGFLEMSCTDARICEDRKFEDVL